MNPLRLKLRTPERITTVVRDFAAGLSNGEEPFFIDITPPPEAEIDRCHRNVERLVAEKGGTIQFGWSIWIAVGGWLEAIFHSVWIAPDGTIVDPTPDADGERRRLFVIDRTRRFEGRAIPAVRQPLTSDPNVVGACKRWDKADEIQSRYAEGEPLSPDDARAVLCLRGAASLLLMGICSVEPPPSAQRDRKRHLRKEKAR